MTYRNFEDKQVTARLEAEKQAHRAGPDDLDGVITGYESPGNRSTAQTAGADPTPCKAFPVGMPMAARHELCGWPWILHFDAFREAMRRTLPKVPAQGEQLQQVGLTYQLPPCPPVGTILAGKRRGRDSDDPVIFVVQAEGILGIVGSINDFRWGNVISEWSPLTIIGRAPDAQA